MAQVLELTRASAVGPDGAVIYDKLVLPTRPITNYNTAHSGITAEQMRGVTTTLEDVQRDLLELVAAETILIGGLRATTRPRLNCAPPNHKSQP